MVTVDSAGFIEGVQDQLELTPMVFAGFNTTFWAGTPSALPVVGPCGCDIVNNFNGIPQQVKLSQSLDADNQLSLTFLPQSLCAVNYAVYSNSTGALVNTNLSVIQTQYAANAQQCGIMSLTETPIQEITWQLAGRTQWICVVPLPMQICEQCEPTYTPQPYNYACSSFTPAYWFVITGQVTSAGNTASAAGVEGVTVTATVNGQSVSASTTTDTLGNYHLMLNSTLLTAELYDVQITPSRVDTFKTSASTVLAAYTAASPALVALGPGTSLWYNDGSNTVVTNVTTTSIDISYEYICDPSVFIFQSPIANVSADQLSELTVQTTTSPLLLAALNAWNSNSSNDPTNPDFIDYMIANCPNGTVDGCIPGVPLFLSSPSSTGSLDSLVASNQTTTSAVNNTVLAQQAAVVASQGNSTLVSVPLTTGTGPVSAEPVKCLLSNAAAVVTTALVNTTTVVTTSTTMMSGAVASSSYTTAQTVVSSFSWTTTLDYNASYLRNLTNDQIEALVALYTLDSEQVADIVNGSQPFVVDTADYYPVLAGLRVDSTGALSTVPSRANLMLVVPANYPTLLPSVASTTVSSSSQAVANLPLSEVAANTSVFLLDGAVQRATTMTSPITQQTTVVSSQLISSDDPPTASGSSLLVDLSNGVQMKLGLSSLTVQTPLSVLPSVAGQLTFTNSSVPIVVVASSPTVSVVNGTTVYNQQTPGSVRITLPFTAAIVDASHTLNSYLTAARSPNDVYDSTTHTYSRSGLTYSATVTHAFKTIGINPSSNNITLPVTHAQTITGVLFSDISVQSVSGNVYIGPNELLPRIEHCGMPGIVVTVYSADDTQRSNPLSMSAITDNFGSFSVTVPIGEPVVLVPSYSNGSIQHEFFPPLFDVVGGASPLSGVTFWDIQLQNLSLSIVGGLCEASIVPGVNPLLVVDS